MLFSTWTDWLFNASSSCKRCRGTCHPSVLAEVQLLESRTLLSATLAVINTNDGGDGSLRAAIDQANADNAGDTITFASNLAGGTIHLTSGELAITGSMTISGPGASQLTIDGGWNGVPNSAVGSRILDINNSAATVNITRLTLTHGNARTDFLEGGAILNNGNLTLSDVTISANTGTNYGAGISNGDGGALASTNVTIAGNLSDGGSNCFGGISNFGTWTSTNDMILGNLGSGSYSVGGVSNYGMWTSTNDTISGNSTSSGAGGVLNIGTWLSTSDTISENSGTDAGGAISAGTWFSTNDTISENVATTGGGVFEAGGAWSSTGDTISENTATDSGGGVYNGGTWTSVNTTIFGNSAGNFGGGIYTFASKSTLINDTITGNTAISAGGVSTSGGQFFALNTIISGNSGSDLAGSIANSTTSNLIGGDVAQIFAADVDGQPLLANNGGPTKTIALKTGSPAIGKAVQLTTLAQNLAASSTAMTVANGTFIGVGQPLKIDNEIISVTVAGNLTFFITRAAGGGTAHSSGTAIKLAYDQTGALRTANDIGAVEKIVSGTTALTINAPATASVNQNSSLTFSGTNSISVADSSGATQRLRFSVAHGSLSLSSSTGVTVTGGGTATLTITGTASNLNAVLAGLKYMPASGYQGTDTLSLSSTDTSNNPTGAGSVAITVNVAGVNHVPVVVPATFSLDHSSAINTVVGNVSATDPDSGQALTFSLVGGNFEDAFAINPTTGLLTVANTAALNIEVTPTFLLSVKVTDSGTPALSATATITINLTGGPHPPVVVPTTLTLAENSALNTVVGTVAATDSDASRTLTYRIIRGNIGGAFALNPATGVLTVAKTAALNFEANPTFLLSVGVADNGTPSSEGTGVITINLTKAQQTVALSGGSSSVTYLNSSAAVKVLPSIVIDGSEGTSNVSKVEISFFVQKKGLLSDYSIGNLASLGTVTQSGATTFKKAGGTHNVTITLNPGVTDSEVQQALREITFKTTKFDPKKKPLGRSLEVQVIDGSGVASNKITTAIVARKK